MSKGRPQTEETKRKISLAMKGRTPTGSPFKKGHTINNGRAPWNKGLNTCRNPHKYRKIMEKHLGRKLKSHEVVHHINHNQLDNRIKNLKVMNAKEHGKMHADEQWRTK